MYILNIKIYMYSGIHFCHKFYFYFCNGKMSTENWVVVISGAIKVACIEPTQLYVA